MDCRAACGACCTAPSITGPLPGHPDGKPAGVPCVNLREDYSCRVYDIRPKVCRNFSPQIDYCGNTREEGMHILTEIEHLTAPQIQI